MREIYLESNIAYAESQMYKQYLNYSGETNEMWVKHLRDCVHVALCEEVTSNQREILLLFMQGYTQSEIAEMMGVNKSTISRSKHRALKRVARVLRYATPRTLGKATVPPEYLGSIFADGHKT